MAITRYSNGNPWRELDQLTNRLSRMFEPAAPVMSSMGPWAPAVSVEETHDELVITAELPGVSASDVDVHTENNVLTIRGEKKEERREDQADRRYHLWERSYGSFQRAFALPSTVDAEAISAEFQEGLLRVRLPKAPEAKSRRIEIRTGVRESTELGGTQK